ncbi:putative membrane protein YccC [Klebsiella sp. BIGb0407]|nr:putative membrane protein YccC [Klebsiella sp. BIGb0407]
MNVLISLFTLAGILSGFIITQLLVQTGLKPGLNAFLICSSLVLCCGVAGNILGKLTRYLFSTSKI